MKTYRKVSVIIPVYNAEKYLKETMESILGQTYKNLEIILVNDASRDNSYELCKKYTKTDDRIILINNEVNKGQSVSRNIALNHATGYYVCFVDSDDIIPKEAIEKFVHEIEIRDVDVLGFNAKVISEQKEENYAKAVYDASVLTGEDYLVRMIQKDQMYDVVWMYFYKKEIIDKNHVRFVEGRVFEDEVWVPDIFINTSRASYFDYEGYWYYIREASTMTRKDIFLKKYDDAKKNCEYLISLSKNFKNEKSGKLFADYVVRIYMESTKYLLNSGKKEQRKIDYKFIRRNIFEKKTIIKYIIFKISKKAYFRLKNVSI